MFTTEDGQQILKEAGQQMYKVNLRAVSIDYRYQVSLRKVCSKVVQNGTRVERGNSNSCLRLRQRFRISNFVQSRVYTNEFKRELQGTQGPARNLPK